MDTSAVKNPRSKLSSDATLLLGSDISATFLLQIAIFWIEQGYRVIYIRPTPHTQLPADIHGVSTIQESLLQLSNLLRFLYLPSWRDLLQFLYGIQDAASVPHVVLVEDLHFYCAKELGASLEEAHAALILASLQDSVSACARKLETPTHLVVSFDHAGHQDFKLHPIVDMFFPSSVWVIRETPDDKVTLTRSRSFFEETETDEILFTKSQKQLLFFEGIKKIFNRE